jgi:integral membrane protein
VDLAWLARLRLLSLVEGTSTLLLFGVAMPLKYWADMPLAVRVAGSLHGALFIALLGMLAMSVRRLPLSRAMAVQGALAAVLPGGPFWFDGRLARLAASPDAPR